MSPDKIVRMANQIATFFASQPGEQEGERVAAHLRDFWEPRMRARLIEITDEGGQDLTPLAAAAVDHLRAVERV